MMSKPIKAVEERIASTLAASDDVKSADLAALIQEVETAAQAADEAAAKVREAALDPAVVVDAAKIGAAMASATLTRDRLQAALPRLQQRHKEVREEEYAAAWMADYAEVKAKRDAAAAALRERYPVVVDELIGLMERVADTDAEVNRINAAAPYGDYPRLRGVELTARGLDRLLQPDISIIQELRLPCFDHASGMPLMAYPLPEPNFAVEFVNSIPPDNFDWRNWQEETERRDVGIRAENARVIAQAEERQRAREEREAAEAKDANQVAVGDRQ